MNRIKTSDVLDPAIQQPFTARSLDFLQDSNKDVIKGVVMSMIGKLYDPTKYYIISGLYSYGTNQFSEGYIFFNGELYYCAGKSTTTAITNRLVLTIDTTSTIGPPYDSVVFTDGSSKNVHLLRRFVLSDAVSGSGTVDYYSCIFIGRNVSYPLVTKAYNASEAEVVGGFTAGSYNTCEYNYYENKINLLVIGQQFVIASGVRKLTIDLPAIITGADVNGCSVVGFQQGGSSVGFTGIAYIELGKLTIKKIEINTDFPVMVSDGYLYLSITLNL